MYLKDFILIISIFFISSCDGIKQALEDDNLFIHLNIDSLVSNPEPIKYSDLFSDYQFIPLETTNHKKIGAIDDIKIDNDTIFIFDRKYSKKVYLFNICGNLLAEIGRIGRGPGEYISPTAFDINSNENLVALFDISNLRLNFFNYKGAYIKSIPFNEAYQNFIISEESLVFYNPPIQGLRSNTEKLIHLFNHNGAAITSFMKNNEIPQVSFIRSKGSQFYKTNKAIRLHMPFNDTIYSVEKNGVEPFISLDSKLYKLAEDERLKLNSKPGNFFNYGINKLYFINNYSENDELCYFNFNIGVRRYHIFHFFRKKTICTYRLVDDLTHINPYLFHIANTEIIGIIDNISQFDGLKETVLDAKLELSNEQKARLLEACAEHSPILILYKLKNN